MAKLVINSYEEFASHLGEKLGESDWLQIDQERINKFADATLDPQWIHVDVERAKVESPYHSTIAHGYLTLSVLPYLWQQILEVNNLKMLVNYGMDQMRFGQPVITGSRVRLVATLHDIRTFVASVRPASSSALRLKVSASQPSQESHHSSITSTTKEEYS